MSLAGRAASVPESERVEATCRGLQVTAGLFTRPAEVADGLRRGNGHASNLPESWPLPCEETDKRPLIA
jgi:hypothetical protein